jgi:hypothetical protein
MATPSKVRILLSPLAVLLVLTLASCGGEKAGTVIEVSEVPGGQGLRVDLPAGQLEVSVSGVVDDADGKGGTFVGVDWDLDPFAQPDRARLAYALRVKDSEIAFVADGKRYPVKAPYRVLNDRAIQDRAPQTFFLALEDEPEELTLEVTYDGLTQRVDALTGEHEPGQADRLYDPVGAGVPQPDCPGTSAVKCDVRSVLLLPYVATVGWADPGRAWAVVDVRTFYDGPDILTARTTTDRLTMDGAAPAVQLNGGTQDSPPSASRYVAFSVDADAVPPLRIQQAYVDENGRRHAADREVPLRFKP